MRPSPLCAVSIGGSHGPHPGCPRHRRRSSRAPRDAAPWARSRPCSPAWPPSPSRSASTRSAAPGNLSAFDFGCETWLFWDKSTDDVDPQYAIRYEVRVNGVSDGAQTDIDRWITYGTQASNTYSVQAVDGAGNRSPTSSVGRRPDLLSRP